MRRRRRSRPRQGRADQKATTATRGGVESGADGGRVDAGQHGAAAGCFAATAAREEDRGDHASAARRVAASVTEHS